MRLKLFVTESLQKESKQRFGEFEFECFGGSDVVNKLLGMYFDFDHCVAVTT